MTAQQSGFHVDLTDVAPDARALVQAFRDNGAVSFEHVPVPVARENYRRSCSANGVARENVEAVETMSVPVDGGTIRLRLYRNHNTVGALLRPIIYFIHGGGWVIGDLETHDSLCRFIANRTGCIVAAVDYRLAPEFPYPVPLEDCWQALGVLVDGAEAFGIDMTHIAVFGDSAGGNMATVIANTPGRWRPGSNIVGQVLLYPVTDLTMQTSSYNRVTDGFALTAPTMRWFADHYAPAEFDRADVSLSPLLCRDQRAQPPMFIVTAGHDPLSDEGIAYAGLAAARGARVIHHHLPRHMHGIFTAAGKIKTGEILLKQACEFILSLSVIK
ncbi:alpha/beta hydrolase [Phyllobacterium zundukense]|uniref:Alpha/beta hydrolase fold-3 domain-containing protein n=1 Tax=Phyllobacterium zundukense TaxID=1867719 RepID=A0A2N9W0N7_9HYPH|nr:alpha/beta hydrolase [Phyllobacterium zundukense]ATU95449.1 hypothetical protein BLM14_27595 [Phyllobacterium zundukense]PIO45305.1 hypothetical protein B5P45_08595 [Phyllobacterium zundukense]